MDDVGVEGGPCRSMASIQSAVFAHFVPPHLRHVRRRVGGAARTFVAHFLDHAASMKVDRGGQQDAGAPRPCVRFSSPARVRPAVHRRAPSRTARGAQVAVVERYVRCRGGGRVRPGALDRRAAARGSQHCTRPPRAANTNGGNGWGGEQHVRSGTGKVAHGFLPVASAHALPATLRPACRSDNQA